jgi:hypothetical protein
LEKNQILAEYYSELLKKNLPNEKDKKEYNETKLEGNRYFT